MAILECIIFITFIASSCAVAPASQPASRDPRFEIGGLLFSDDFADLTQFVTELENGGQVHAADGQLIVDVPAGCTVWFKPLIAGPVMIEYDATVIKAGGPNDRGSDLNCFWMARDARSPENLFDTQRSGQFKDYDHLRCYYVGLGGNSNTTTRFRRYIGQRDNRPLLPEHDLKAPEDLIVPNVSQRIRLIACGNLIQYWRDDRKLFELNDPQPYTSGWFAFRTVSNHVTIRNFRVYRLRPV